MLFATEKSFIIYNANTKTSVNSNICPKEKYTWKKDKKTKRQKDKKTYKNAQQQSYGNCKFR